jgi:hypothetical protein
LKANILQMEVKRDKHGNPCRKIKPSDPKGRFTYPSAEYADKHPTDPYGDVRRYLKEVKEFYGDDLEAMEMELWKMKGEYTKQYYWFDKSIIKQDLKERRRQWCRGLIEEVNRFIHRCCY